jgi:hypothetical protein
VSSANRSSRAVKSLKQRWNSAASAAVAASGTAATVARSGTIAVDAVMTSAPFVVGASAVERTV